MGQDPQDGGEHALRKQSPPLALAPAMARHSAPAEAFLGRGTRHRPHPQADGGDFGLRSSDPARRSCTGGWDITAAGTGAEFSHQAADDVPGTHRNGAARQGPGAELALSPARIPGLLPHMPASRGALQNVRQHVSLTPPRPELHRISGDRAAAGRGPTSPDVWCEWGQKTRTATMKQLAICGSTHNSGGLYVAPAPGRRPHPPLARS